MIRANKLITEDIDVLLRNIAFPAATGLLFNILYHIVDTFYVSRISTHTLSSLSFSSMLLFFILAINFGFSIATRVHIGFCIGKRKNKLKSVFIQNSIFLVFSLAFFLSLFIYIFLEDIFILMNAKEESIIFAINYMQIMLFSIIPMFLSLNINAILAAHGDTKSYRNILAIGLILNIILTPIFIYGFTFIPSLGFSGVAFSTSLIYYIIFIYMLKKLLDKKLINCSNIFKFKPSKKPIIKLLQQAYPSSLNMIIMSFGNILLIYFISYYGYKAVAAFGIGYRIEQLILLPILGINVAITILVSSSLAAKKINRIKEIFYKAIKYTLTFSIIGIAILTLLGEYILLLFDKDSSVINMAYEYIIYKSLALIGTSLIFVCIAMLQGLKKPKIIPTVNFLRQIIISPIVFYMIISILNLDITKIWISILMITYLTALFLIYYLKNQLNKLKN